MVYLDTSVAIPLFVPEAASDAVSEWLDMLENDLVAADWILTEFASALFVKARRGDLADEHAKAEGALRAGATHGLTVTRF